MAMESEKEMRFVTVEVLRFEINSCAQLLMLTMSNLAYVHIILCGWSTSLIFSTISLGPGTSTLYMYGKGKVQNCLA